MIIYLDTSAVVPLLIHEPGSASNLQIWTACDDAVISRLTYVEAAAALAAALRSSRMTDAQHQAALTSLDAVRAQCDVIDLDQPLAAAAATMAYRHGLRGNDAVHCASAVHLGVDDVVAVSGDLKLLRAWATLGMSTFNVNTGMFRSP